MNIRIEHITKKYGSQTVLADFSLDIENGGKVRIKAPSGAGKTTLLRIIAGLEKADEGTVRFSDNSGNEVKPRISYAFQEDRLLEGLDAVRNLSAVLGKSRSESEWRDELRMIGLTEFEGKKVSELSGGMRRRIAVVRAMAAESDVVLLDEPFNGLDETAVKEVAKYIEMRIGDRNLILVTHDHGDSVLLTIHTVMLQ